MAFAFLMAIGGLWFLQKKREAEAEGLLKVFEVQGLILK